MNRSDIVRAVARREKIPIGTVDRIIDGFLDVVGLSLSCGEEVNLRTFGKFEPRQRAAVVRKNPKTGIEHEVPEKTSVGFIPSPVLKDRLNKT